MSRPAAGAGLLLAAALLSACSSRPKTVGTPPSSTPSVSTSASPQASPAFPSFAPPTGPTVAGADPGHASPSAAVAGFIDAAVAGQNTAACGFVVPARQAACRGFLNLATFTASGPVTLGPPYVLGAQAIVAPVGRLCAGGSCFTNTNPRAGLPASDAQFDAAYRSAVGSAGAGLSPTAFVVGCRKVNGQWYVDVGQ